MSYHSEYMASRYKKRRKEAFEILGDRCIKCGSTKDLELDHKNRGLKAFDGTRMTAVSHDKFLKEIWKCQVLCRECHILKTILEIGRKPARGTHGTLSSYRYCKCHICRKANSDWQKDYKTRTASSMVAATSS